MGHLSQISQSASIQFPNRWYSSFAISERSLVLFRIPLLLKDLLLQRWVLSVCMYKKFLKVMGEKATYIQASRTKESFPSCDISAEKG